MMSAIIMRSALVHWGQNPAPEVHSIITDWRGERRVVTWADVMRERRERMNHSLRYKTFVPPWQPYRLWVAYFGQDSMGGWHAFIGNRKAEHWIDRDRRWLMRDLLDLFPIVPLTLPFDGELRRSDTWDRWKIAFAKKFQRGVQCRKPRGMAIVWWDGHHERLRLEAP